MVLEGRRSPAGARVASGPPRIILARRFGPGHVGDAGPETLSRADVETSRRVSQRAARERASILGSACLAAE
jgi:hypothetical protein